ncbi:MAG: ATP-binding cassette domain-containing protein [Buchnera aphidicola (Eriosoma harunire)]
MSIIHIKNAYLSFSTSTIFKNSELKIKKNERICLLGKNGIGKSTLLNVIFKKQELDKGTIIYKNQLKIAYLPQKKNINLNTSVYEFISHPNNILNDTSLNITNTNNNYIKNKKQSIKKSLNTEKIDSINKSPHEIKKIISYFNLKDHDQLNNLSGGDLQKTMLAQVLTSNADLLLLDEPTNHLDLPSIVLLEQFCKNFLGGILFISHDRYFIQNICTKIVNLYHGILTTYPGDYTNFLQQKKINNDISILHNKKLKKLIEKEEIWLNTSTKARCTRNEGKIKKLQYIKKMFHNEKQTDPVMNITINYKQNHQKIICKIKNISYYINNYNIITKFSDTITQKDKIALIGKNGSGKTTMLKLILGHITPKTGYITLNKNINFVYFDQHGSYLNYDKNIIENLSHIKQEVTINGKKKHILKYLNDFLFSNNDIKKPIKYLSGGEQTKVLLAKIFLIPSNVLILDEPTNNLDIDTLHILENAIINYTGTILLISHDRQFIKNTANRCWCFNDSKIIKTDIKNYLYSTIQQKKIKLQKQKNECTNNNVSNQIIHAHNKYKKLSYHLKQELYNLPKKIENIEKNIFLLQNKMKNKFFYTQNSQEITLQMQELHLKERELDQAFNRWQELEILNNKK